MIMSVRIPSIGEVTLDMNSDEFNGGVHVIKGHDEEHNMFIVKCSRISWQDDFIHDYGWVRIVEYITGGVSVLCNHYTSIS